MTSTWLEEEEAEEEEVSSGDWRGKHNSLSGMAGGGMAGGMAPVSCSLFSALRVFERLRQEGTMRLARMFEGAGCWSTSRRRSAP